MSQNRLITENQLDEWVRGHARDAQGIIVELVWRLVAASSPEPAERRFPLGDSIGQHGPDGELVTESDFPPFVPDGRSYWEIGTGEDPGAKATSDYNSLASAMPEGMRQVSTFVFVTPLSGRKGWEHTWKEDQQSSWIENRRSRKEWSDVCVIDGTGLIDWLQHFPAVEKWLASIMEIAAKELQTPEQRWAELRVIGEPPPLTPHVFLANRSEACDKLKQIFSGSAFQLKLDTHFPDQVVDFVSAYVANMDENARVDTIGRCLIVSGAEAWNAITELRDPHVLIAEFDLDGTDGTRLLAKARKGGHAVIFGGAPGGVPHPNRQKLSDPRVYQVKEALEQAGYKEERARILSQKSGGNLGSLLRCLQNLSIMPEWAEDTAAAELAIAAMLGSWDEGSDADRTVVEYISGKSYGEWIGVMREIALRPGTPLTQRNGVWKVISRYEAWYALGPKLFDDYLSRFKNSAITVLKEKDPKFDLPGDERFTARIHGKVLVHSDALRTGLAETLALLGGHPAALKSCSFNRAEATAVFTIRELFNGADWILWASLNPLLPLLAEAVPGEFLDAVEVALLQDPCPFDEVFSQEGDGLMGGNYLTGLLWALETLAWDASQITRVVVILGELAAHDPGGKWANRPSNSLTTIFLPWLPQTTAPIEKRKTALVTLIDEQPEMAWKLLLSLLPRSHQSSSGTHKPAWRDIIDDNWSRGVTQREYWEQVAVYAELAIAMAKTDLSKLTNLVDRLDDLPQPAFEQLLAHLGSDAVIAMPEVERLPLWNELEGLVSKHRKYKDAEWAMPPEFVDKIAATAAALAPKSPILIFQRLFGEHDLDLYDEAANFQEQERKLEARRQSAVQAIATTNGMDGVLAFAKNVRSPWRVGIAFGTVGTKESDDVILPSMVETDEKNLFQFVAQYVYSRFYSLGWQWVDGLDITKWSRSQIGQFFAFLPFQLDIWARVSKILGEDEVEYWSRTNAAPYGTDSGLELAVDRLVKYGRPMAAVRCLYQITHKKQPINARQTAEALLAAVGTSESSAALDAYELVEIIKALQEHPDVDPEELYRIEAAYLSLFTANERAYPKTLEQRLADDSEFFCEIVRLIFRSKNDDRPLPEATEERKNMAANAYRLLHSWRTPPGRQRDGTYLGDALKSWLHSVRTSTKNSGHLEVAMSITGQVLIHCPADPDGFWIHHAAAQALNGKDADDLRSGFVTGLYNSRGAQWVDPKGEPERRLAAAYRDKAEATERAGFHRLGSTLKEIAASYDRDAEHISSTDLFDD